MNRKKAWSCAAYLVASSLTIVALGALVPAAPAHAAGCGSGAAVIVAGTGAARNSAGVPVGGMTGAARRYRDAGYQVEYVNYPTWLFPVGPIPYDQDVAIGKDATTRTIAGYQQRCPGKPVKVIGYSQGARIAGDVIADSANGRGKPVRVGNQVRTVSTAGLSGELYSDPRRDGGNGQQGVENILIGLVPGTTMSGPRAGGFGSVPVTQVCVAGDGVCDTPDPIRDPLGSADSLLGYFLKHGAYPARMDQRPVSGESKWRSMQCTQAGNTRDCVVGDESSARMLAERPQDGGPTGVLTTVTTTVAANLVDSRRTVALPAYVRVNTLRPLIGGGDDSTDGEGVVKDVLIDGQVPQLGQGEPRDGNGGVPAPDDGSSIGAPTGDGSAVTWPLANGPLLGASTLGVPQLNDPPLGNGSITGAVVDVLTGSGFIGTGPISTGPISTGPISAGPIGTGPAIAPPATTAPAEVPVTDVPDDGLPVTDVPPTDVPPTGVPAADGPATGAPVANTSATGPVADDSVGGAPAGAPDVGGRVEDVAGGSGDLASAGDSGTGDGRGFGHPLANATVALVELKRTSEKLTGE